MPVGAIEEGVIVNLTRARAVTNGYMSDEEIQWIAQTASRYERIVEVGAWTGRSTLAWLDNTKGNVLVVDEWKGSTEGDLVDILARMGSEWAWREFVYNTRHSSNLEIMKMESTLAAELCREQGRTFQCVFIDASHDYASVKSDIEVWLPLVESGAVICGHDYRLDSIPGVKQAVDELLPDAQTMLPLDHDHSIWWMTKP